MTKINRNYIKKLVPGIALSIALFFMLFIFAPLEIYFNNLYEFWFDFYLLSPVLVTMFLIAFLANIILLSIMLLCNEKLYQAVVIAEAIFFVVLYIQGNFLVSVLPPLDGSTIAWENYTKEHLKSAILVVAVVAGIIFSLKRFSTIHVFKWITRLSLIMTMVFSLTLISLFYFNKGYTKKEAAIVTHESILEMSSDKNFIIFVLDSIDSETLARLMNMVPEYETIFNDFTYYRNTFGTYPFTRESMPFIVSGIWFENKQSFYEYTKTAYSESPLFNMLNGRGYKLDMYDPEIPINTETVSLFGNLKTVAGVSSWQDFVMKEIKITGFKYAPYGLKQFFVIDINDFTSLFPGGSGVMYSGGSNQMFYQKLLEQDITTIDKKCFKLIHLEGAHMPYRYDKDVNFVDVSSGTYEWNVEASLTITEKYLEQLKASGVYDNSVILIMADHGHSDVTLRKRQNPMLFVKGINERHSMMVSEAPISYEDLQPAFAKLANGEKSYRVFNWEEGDLRQRRCLLYEYTEEEYMKEYIQTGYASNPDTMYATGREFNR